MGQIMTIDEALRKRMPFGKYKGLNLLSMFKEDPTYFEWALSNAAQGKLKEAMKLIIEDNKFRKRSGFSPRR